MRTPGMDDCDLGYFYCGHTLLHEWLLGLNGLPQIVPRKVYRMIPLCEAIIANGGKLS
jgi:hypothetical protein